MTANDTIPWNKIPITVGIVGHLDAIITDEHIRAVTGLFQDLYDRYPDSPVCLFSQLAEGADIAIADLFLDIGQRTGRNYHLVAPLPFSVDKYRLRFDANTRTVFDRLWSRCTRSFVVNRDETSPPEDHYRSGGQFVADSSIILIAIWDQDINDKIGGTADIVWYKKEGTFPNALICPLNEKKGSLLSIPCNRKGKDRQLHWPPLPLLDELLKDKSIQKALEKIEHMNGIGQRKAFIRLPASDTELIPSAVGITPPQALLQSYYCLTNTLAIYNRRIYVQLMNTFFLAGFFIIGIFECYKHLYPAPPLLLGVLTIIAATSLFNVVSSRWKNHLRFLESRILSEAIRVQFFWNISGVGKNVAVYILRIHKAELTWIKHILYSIYGVCFEEAGAVDRSFIDEYWIADQYNFFDRRTKELWRNKRRWSSVSRIALVLAFIVMTGILMFGPSEQTDKAALDRLIILIGLLLGIFALSKAYSERRGFHQVANQYALMRNLFGAAVIKIRKLEQRIGPENIHEIDEMIRDVYYEVGREAVIESGTWYQIFKDKEPEMEGLGG